MKNYNTLKQHLQSRLNFLNEVAAADRSEDCISTLGQIHEIRYTLDWIAEHENTNADTTEPQTSPTHDTPKGRTYKDGVKDAYNDVLKMIYADGSDADDIRNALEAALCNN